jgi:hypothetical protein
LTRIGVHASRDAARAGDERKALRLTAEGDDDGDGAAVSKRGLLTAAASLRLLVPAVPSIMMSLVLDDEINDKVAFVAVAFESIGYLGALTARSEEVGRGVCRNVNNGCRWSH